MSKVIKRKFKEGDFIKRKNGRTVYEVITYGNFGKWGDLKVRQMGTGKTYVIHSYLETFVLFKENESTDMFPIF